MRDCVEEGILQGYFDGELPGEMMESVASHLASCLVCAQAARELEGESLLLSQALEPEFALSVPTERLRARVDAAIAGKRVVSPVRAAVTPQAAGGWWRSLAELFTLSPQRAFGYAGLAAILLFVAVFGLVQYRRAAISNPPKVAKQKQTPAPVPTLSPDNSPGPIAAVSPAPKRENPTDRFVKAGHKPKKAVQPRPAGANDEARVKLLPGERSYLKTIAALDNSIKAESSRPMRPALQSEYQRNLAMVDRAIAATRSAAKSNPNDPDAAEFMFAAYQTKVDFLNQVADARLSNRPH